MMVQGPCKVSIESGKGDGSSSRDGCEGVPLESHRLELGLSRSPVSLVGKSEPCQEVVRPRHAVLPEEFVW